LHDFLKSRISAKYGELGKDDDHVIRTTTWSAQAKNLVT